MFRLTGIKELYDIYTDHPVAATDSRSVPRGSIFFALKGDTFDGNFFAGDALRGGASYAVVDDPRTVPLTDEAGRYLLVSNVLAALGELAEIHRKNLGIPVIAITGTNGKTTTKELTYAVLSRKYRAHHTKGNLNNHIGVPLTLLSMPADTEIAVVEMGASGPGEIAALCGIADPDYGIITNIGIAHLEGFGGPEGVRKAKGELYDYIALHGGTVFVNGGDHILTDMVSERPGLNTEVYDNSAAEGMKNNLTGNYNIYNIAAAVAIGRHFGVSEKDISSAVAGYVPLTDRSRRIDTGRNILVADCYNANPSSMLTAIENFAAGNSLPENAGEPMEKALVLGDMLELGQWTETEHERVLKAVFAGRVSTVYLVGTHFTGAYSRMREDMPAGMVALIFPDADKLAAHFREARPAGLFMLIKGSRGTALEKIIPLL